MPADRSHPVLVEIRDRLKDVIISGGENISSIEVESVLLRVPGGAGSGDCWLAARTLGRSAARLFVLRQGAQTNEAELREFARANLAHFKAPQSVTFIKELPRPRPEIFRNTF